jgi:hypothetical protein
LSCWPLSESHAMKNACRKEWRAFHFPQSHLRFDFSPSLLINLWQHQAPNHCCSSSISH